VTDAAPSAARRATLPSGIGLPFVEQGDESGTPVVLLHAYADSWRSFERVLPQLPSSIHAFAVTQRGHGLADKPASGYRVEDFAADLASFMDEVHLARAVLVASSSATFTVQRFAVDHPRRTLGLVFVGVPWSLADKRGGALATAIAKLTDPVDPSFVRDFVESTVHGSVPDEHLAALVAESLQAPAHVWKQTLAGLLAAVPAAATSRIDVPALILWGDRDAFVSREDQHRLVAALPGSRLVVYEAAGHVLHWEQPERVAADIAAFALACADS
jgi:pimeloyl-ACP methyl ester carboxylesterase